MTLALEPLLDRTAPLCRFNPLVREQHREVGKTMDVDRGSARAEPHAADSIFLSLSVAQVGKKVLVAGELDITTAPELQAFVLAALDSGVPALQLDLSEVTFLDSSGVRVMILASRHATALGIEFAVLCPVTNTAVRQVIDILHLHATLSVLDTD